jgi:D-amino-acid oxidase
LGGCLQPNSWDPLPDPNLAVRIMKRCITISPELVLSGQGIEGLDIIRHGVGLRPMREGGARVEKERIDGNWVVHNYGHGGYGYQVSFGCALTAVKEVEEVLQKRNHAKL